jgi:cell fate (sporulation/competence/biofilm development) regulator YmcA (YheA/YmcA/DUF963 family)
MYAILHAGKKIKHNQKEIHEIFLSILSGENIEEEEANKNIALGDELELTLLVNEFFETKEDAKKYLDEFGKDLSIRATLKELSVNGTPTINQLNKLNIDDNDTIGGLAAFIIEVPFIASYTTTLEELKNHIN